MRWICWMLMCVVVTAVSVSCTGRPTDSTDSSESVSPDVSEQPTSDDQHNEAIASEDDALPPPEPVPFLEPPTSPEQRASQVQSGRADPFAPLPSSPIVVPTRVSPPAPPQPVAQPVATTPATNLPQIEPIPLATAPVPVESPRSSTRPADPVQPQPSPTAIAPSAPSASLLESIEVSGVVQVGGQTSVIVRVPNEQSSRTAAVGDRLANGRVLLKRVDMSGGGDPVVVLEQDGVEVMHSVGLLGG